MSEKQISEQDAQQHKEQVSDAFNLVADSYDHPALRFFPFAADTVVDCIKPESTAKVLDVAAGTGAMTLAFAKTVPLGRVTSIDLAQNMQQQAQQKVAKSALYNVDFFIMDGECPEFPSDYFDYTVCGFGLFFMPDMQRAVNNWLQLTKPGGTVAFSCFTENAFSPLIRHFVELLEQYGVTATNMASQRLQDEHLCEQLMLTAGLGQVQVRKRQVGYHLNDEQDWWSVIWGSGARNFFNKIPEGERSRFKEQHLEQISGLKTEKGLWLDVEIMLVSGRVS